MEYEYATKTGPLRNLSVHYGVMSAALPHLVIRTCPGKETYDATCKIFQARLDSSYVMLWFMHFVFLFNKTGVFSFKFECLLWYIIHI